MIVKVYQGPVASDQVLTDQKSVPSTAAERMRKALPFEGQLVQDAFRRNDFTYGVAMFQHGYLGAGCGVVSTRSLLPSPTTRMPTTISALSGSGKTTSQRHVNISNRLCG